MTTAYVNSLSLHRYRVGEESVTNGCKVLTSHRAWCTAGLQELLLLLMGTQDIL